MPMPLENEHYTYADYLKWDGDERFELINGKAVMMAGPSFTHQDILGEIYAQLRVFLKDKPCKAIVAPFDVRLFAKADDKSSNIDTVVQPDIFVVCDRNKIDERGIKGAPDMVIEILSPSNFRHDRIVKLNLYNQAGVREYWIVDPTNKSVQVFLPDKDGKLWIHEEYYPSDIAKVNILEGCTIDLSTVFPEE